MHRITVDPRVRWGTPCLRDTGTTVAHVVALDHAGLSLDRILDVCPELTLSDVDAALAWHRRYGDAGLGPQPPEPGERHPRITADPSVQGGYPVIAGTRIPVDAVLGMWEEGLSIEEILEEYPDLEPDDVDAALAYDSDAFR